MGLAAYMDLTRMKLEYTARAVGADLHCDKCGNPQETLCGWEKDSPLRWVCPECYGEMKSQSKGEKS